MRRIVLAVPTNGSGVADVYSPRVSGLLHAVHYVPDGSAPYDNTVDVTVTSEVTGETLLSRTNVSAAVNARPRVATSAADGTASLYASGGTAVQDKIALANDRIRVVLAQGGASKTGKFHFIIDED